MGDAFVLEQRKERRAPGDAVHEIPPVAAAVPAVFAAS
jgi:hypothetical protein